MMLVIGYKSLKDLKGKIGEELRYKETSVFGNEYKDNGTFTVAHRPLVTKDGGREFFAKVTVENGLIKKVK